MRKLLFLALLLLPALPAFSQGMRWDDVVFRSTTVGISGVSAATVTVCTSAGTGTPCTPTATIYTNRTLVTTQTNPFTTDGSGNYGFWAPPGTYVITFTGAGITSTTKTITLSPELASAPTWSGAHIFSAGPSAIPLTVNAPSGQTANLANFAVNGVNQVAINNTGQIFMTPTATGIAPLVINAPSGITANLASLQINSVEAFRIGPRGDLLIQPISTGAVPLTVNSPGSPANDVFLVQIGGSNVLRVNTAGALGAGSNVATGALSGDMSASRSATIGTYFLGTDGTVSLFRNGTTAFFNGASLLSGTDNAFDLGASGANRFRDLFLGRNANIGGTVAAVNGATTVGNGLAVEVAQSNLTAQTANVGTTTLLATGTAPGATLYRVNCYTVVTTAAGTSSTLPQVNVTYTDRDTSVVTSIFAVCPTTSGNTVGTASQGSAVLSAAASTNIQFTTAGYASNPASAMNYAVRIRLEAF